MLTQKQTEIIRRTFAEITCHANGSQMSIQEIAENLAMPFYKRLFDRDPGLAAYFTNVHDTSCKFAMVLKSLVESLGFEDRSKDIIKLGERHAKYAKDGKFIITSKNFEDVGVALVETIQNSLDIKGYTEFTSVEVSESWVTLYKTIVGIMMPSKVI